MLSLRRCRELLPTSSLLSDDEVENVRAHLYAIAGLAVDALSNDVARDPGSRQIARSVACGAPVCSFGESLRLVAEDSRTELEERAAIIELDGNLSRDEAERAAIAMMLRDSNN